MARRAKRQDFCGHAEPFKNPLNLKIEWCGDCGSMRFSHDDGRNWTGWFKPTHRSVMRMMGSKGGSAKRVLKIRATPSSSGGGTAHTEEPK